MILALRSGLELALGQGQGLVGSGLEQEAGVLTKAEIQRLVCLCVSAPVCSCVLKHSRNTKKKK